MKPKFEIERLKEMTYPEYLKALKKEVKRASVLGRTEFVVLSDFSFKEDTDTKSALIFGEFSGKLQKFYNQQKKYRSSEKDFGRGVAYFEENVDGTTTLHLGIEAGKAKATRIKKNGKKIFNAKEDKSKLKEVVDKNETKTESLQSDAFNYQKTAEKAYNYIFENLNLNKPIVVGVDHTYNTKVVNGKLKSSSSEGGYNNYKTTDHFIVIIGKGMENGVPYFVYIDPGSKINGNDNQSNRLYPLWKGGEMYWYDPNPAWAGAGTYCLTAVCQFK